jgi:hypothetical protein
MCRIIFAFPDERQKGREVRKIQNPINPVNPVNYKLFYRYSFPASQPSGFPAVLTLNPSAKSFMTTKT